MKLTPVGALIKGVFGWLLQTLGPSRTYYQLRECPGKVFKKANCFVLQADIPAERRGIQSDQVNRIDLEYLGSNFVLEMKKEKEEDGDTLYVGTKIKYYITDMKIKYYITDMIWKELQNLEQVLRYGQDGPPFARAAVTKAAAVRLEAQYKDAKAKAEHADVEARAAQHADVEAQHAEERIKKAGTAVMWESAYYNVTYGVPAEAATDARAAVANYNLTADDYVANAVEERRKAAESARRKAAESVKARRKAAESACTAANAAHSTAIDARKTAERAKKAAASRATLFVKGQKDFWKETITGGVMNFEEVMDAIILYNQHVSVRLSKDLLLPINLSVSEEKLLKIVNLVGLFLQTKKVVKVNWSIPIALSLISALLEFSTTIRRWLYSKINVFFCCIMHLVCDPLPRSCRRQVYSLGKWVENLTPCNDIKLKVVKGNMCAIITEGAKVDKEGAIHVPWFQGPFRLLYGLIEEQFPCHPIGSDIMCTFVTDAELCEISAPTITLFYVKCKNEDEFRKIITLVKLMAENCCGSLISYGPNNKVRVRGFEQSVTSFVDNGFPFVYTLDLGNVIVA